MALEITGHPFWSLLTALSGLNDERERARLAATALPSLVECLLSGIVLLDDSAEQETPLIQSNGRVLPEPDTRCVVAELQSWVDGAVPHAPVLFGGGDGQGEVPFSLRALGVGQLVVARLTSLRRRLGTLVVGRGAGHPFSREEGRALCTIAEQFAVGVENLRLYQELHQHSKDLEVLVEKRTTELRRSEEERRALLEREKAYLREEIEAEHNFQEILGESSAMRRVLEDVRTVAPTDANVVIVGETGTGKELIARAVHHASERREKSLIKVNCASIPKELFESEFFGHVRGAFTGAFKDRDGRFQLADRGTLFLDEVGEIPLDMQSKLLRVLQEGEYERVGDERTRKVDVRVIAATNRDLRRESREGRFREDLYYRLNVFPIEVPPLRERGEDIVLLADRFLDRSARKLGRPRPDLCDDDRDWLRRHHWPGNVRELQNVIERAMIAYQGGDLRLEVPGAERTAPAAPTAGCVLPDAEIRRLETQNIRTALAQAGGKVYGPGGAAQLIGVKGTTLASRMKKLGLGKAGT